MSRIHALRTSIDKKLDTLDARAEAYEAQIGASKEAGLDRLERSKRALAEKLDTFAARVRETATDHKDQVIASVDHLKVQLALGKAETRDALGHQKQAIESAVSRLERDADEGLRDLADDFEDLETELVGSFVALDSELEAVALQLEADLAADEAALRSRWEKAKGDLADFRERLKEKRQRAEATREAIEEDFRGGFARIKKAAEFPF